MSQHARFALASLVALTAGLVACSSSDEAGAPMDQPTPDAGADAIESADAAEAGEEAAIDAAQEPMVAAVEFQDASFEACVRLALGKADGALFPEDVATLTALECQDAGITSVAGIEHATALTDLSLWENQVVDLAPLAGLTQLTYLQLGLNAIQDVSALAGLTSLRRLGLSVNQVASLQPLSGLSSLEWLNLDNNAVTDAELVHLSTLTALRWLTLEHNGLSDFSAVQPLLDAGCELYGNAFSAASLAGHNEILSHRGPVDVPAGKVELTVSATGKVALHYRTQAGRLPVRSLFRGALTATDGRVFYRSGERSVEVGRAGSGGLCTGQYANVCTLSVGRRAPDGMSTVPGVVAEVVVTAKLELLGEHGDPSRPLDGEVWASSDKDVMDFALASPNQFDAGSCLFMANTGAMEILLNQHTPADQVDYEGDTDLSERFAMVAGDHVPSSSIPYVLTDVLYAYNGLGGSLLNRDYPFCAGYVKETSSGGIIPSDSTDPDAYVSCSINWFDQLPANWKDLLVATPAAERTVIFVDPLRDEDSQWRVGLFDDDTIERIKYELRTKNAPVLVVYNHYLYWHTNVIVGYDDNLSTGGGCPMVEDSVAYFEEKGMTSYATKIKNRMAALGGCRDTGVFYVRDSIYEGGVAEHLYDYSTDQVTIEKERYSKRIVKLEYDWAKYLGNHTYAMHRK